MLRVFSIALVAVFLVSLSETKVSKYVKEPCYVKENNRDPGVKWVNVVIGQSDIRNGTINTN